MTIVCLGWGSLCWKPGTLPVAADWRNDGPTLPLEFARVSRDGRITLVVTDEGKDVPVLWAQLAVANLDEAIAALAGREGVTSHTLIGRVPTRAGNYPYGERIAAWARDRGIAGVVWTALKPGLDERNRGRVPSLPELQAHIDNLADGARAGALEYVRNAPVQVETRYRAPLLALLTKP